MQRSFRKQDHRCYREVCEAASLGHPDLHTWCERSACVWTPPPHRPSCTHRLRKGPSFKSASVQGWGGGKRSQPEGRVQREGGGLALIPEPTQISGLLPFRRQGTGPGGWDPADFGAAGHVRRSILVITQWSRAAQLGWLHGIYHKEHEETPVSGETDTSLSHWTDTSWGCGWGYSYGLKRNRFLPALWSLHSFGGAERKKVRGPVELTGETGRHKRKEKKMTVVGKGA